MLSLIDERFLRAHDAELVSLRIGQGNPGLSAGLADVGPASRERKKAVDLLIAVRGAAGEVKMHAVLDRPGIGDRHEAHAEGRVLAGPMTISFSRSDRIVQPQRPEPGQSGQIVNVNDDVVESDGHAGSMRSTLDRIRETAVVLQTGRSPEVTPRDSAQIV